MDNYFITRQKTKIFLAGMFYFCALFTFGILDKETLIISANFRDFLSALEHLIVVLIS